MSQCDRILEVLRDGRPHRMEEIHQRVGFCRLNSRIAELRSKRNLNIVCDKTGGQYIYTLLSLEEGTAEPIGAGRPVPSSSESGVGHSAVSGSADMTSVRGEPERRSRFEPLRGGEDMTDRAHTSGGGSGLTGQDAAKTSPPLSGEQLTVWGAAA